MKLHRLCLVGLLDVQPLLVGGLSVYAAPRQPAIVESDTTIEQIEGNITLDLGYADAVTREAVQRTLHSGNTMLAPTRRPCDDEGSAAWPAQGEVAQRVLSTWKQARPRGLVLTDDGTETCLYDGPDRGDDGSPFLSSNVQVLSLIRKSGEPICEEDGEAFRTVEPALFQVSGDMSHRSIVRNYAAVWPLPGVCSEQRCPMVVMLAGVSEHSPVDQAMMFKSFANLKTWGYLRYAERDSGCLAELRSVLLFPQLAVGESWVTDAKMLHDDFTVPLVNHMAKTYREYISKDHVSVIGYSEGAVGAIQAALLYPNVFLAVVAASASIPDEWWQTVPLPTEPESLHWWNSKVYKLRSITVCLGTWDFSNDQANNLKHILELLDASGVKARTSLQVRLYAGLLHNQVWDRVFNRWQGFHEVFWRGHFERLLRHDGTWRTED